MKRIRIQGLLLTIYFGLLLSISLVKAQSTMTKPSFTYYELKSLLLKHKSTVESILSMKRFKLDVTKERPESNIYAYKKDSIQVLVRVRTVDGLSTEIAWMEGPSTLGTLTHDAVYDGFVPVSGNSRYYNRFQKIALYVNYQLAEGPLVPCVLRTVE